MTSIPTAVSRILVQQLQTLLSKKPKTFSGLFILFLKCASNLENFGEKDACPSLIISEIIVSERGWYWNVEKVLLQNTIR